MKAYRIFVILQNKAPTSQDFVIRKTGLFTKRNETKQNDAKR
jgi:hypothetical protein